MSNRAPTNNPMTHDRLARVFNTALISTRAESKCDFSKDLYELIQSPAFGAILSAVKQLSSDQGLTEQDAAASVIRAFRKIDEVWYNYVFQEGVEKLKSPSPNPVSAVSRAKFSE